MRLATLLGIVLLTNTALAADDPFAITGEASIMDEAHLGIVNGQLTVGIPHKDVAAIDGLWAPPLVSSDFRLRLTVCNQAVATDHYTWRPFQVERSGTVGELRVQTVTALVPWHQAGLLKIELENPAPTPCEVPLTISASGTLDTTTAWLFEAPKSKTATQAQVEADALLLTTDKLAIVLQAAEEDLRWHAASSSGQATLHLPAGGRATLHVAFALGSRDDALLETHAPTAVPERCLEAVEAAYAARIAELREKLPQLESSHAGLVHFYNRSLVHFLMNRWDSPQFLLHPYYSTGAVRGGCVCEYLWDFGAIWEILPLVDPEAVKAHIRQFLQTDMTKHFAFNPLTGEAFGPWYMVNQEKTVGLIYYYVKNTGDTAFLDETVAGRTILEHALAHARFGDDDTKPVALIDYGSSNSHLELRRGYPYNHVMPDLNGRRHANYLMAAQLAELGGHPAPELRERAAALKPLLKASLWNPETRWFDFLTEGRRDTRYTVQMFKLFATGVLDAEQEAGLLSHLNETEFLSAQGLHSMAKTDVAYDQVDIDNGGGGNCTCFPTQILERLYKSGHPAEAADILRRILWWGQRMPYWGDSLVANAIDYRKDTPLQSDIDGVIGAQCLIFGLFGVSAEFNGDLRIAPQRPDWASFVALRGLKLRGNVLDIVLEGDQFEVTLHDQHLRAKRGQAILVQGKQLRLASTTAEPDPSPR